MVQDNLPWSQEIEIVPVGPDDLEIWADNGYANLDGEMFYYDTVDKDSFGKVFRLRRCTRNLGGVQTHFVRAGHKVRGFVIAEQHNQLVQALIQIEKFIGINFSTDCTTLDFRIRHLQATPVIFDDFNCPQVSFQFNVIDSDPSAGTTIAYFINIAGNFTTFRLDFGDGTTTSSTINGTHQYSAGASVDPVITIANDQCQIVQTPLTSLNPLVPVAIEAPPFEIPVPTIPPFPNIITPSLIPPLFPNLPPIVFPCLNLTPFSTINVSFIPPFPNIPSTISITPVNIPSTISITPTSIPIIGPGPGGGGGGAVPPKITISGPSPPLPSKITISGPSPPIPSMITISSSPIRVIWPPPPSVTVNWGTPPTINAIISCIVQLICPSATPMAPPMGMTPVIHGEDFEDGFEEPDIAVFDNDYEPGGLGIPSEIRLIVPTIPNIKAVNIDIPSVIRVEADGIPSRILVEPAANFPSTILLDASGIPESIKVVGIPSVISVVGMPTQVQLVMPENPVVEMKFTGVPTTMKLELDMKNLTGEDGGDLPCFAFVPCGKK
jgi:hypothetical protein